MQVVASDYPAHYLVVRGVFALLVAATLAGMLARGRARACFTFQAFLVCQLVIAVPTLIAPSTWWNWRWVLLTDAVEAILFVLVAVELVHKALRAMPPGLRLVSRLFTVILATTVLVLAILLPRLWDPETGAQVLKLARTLIGGALYGSAFLFVAFIAAISYARVPIDPVHRDIAGGLGLWAIFGALRSITSGTYMFVAICMNAVLAYWAYKAWRPEESTALSRRALERFQPWRVRRITR